MRALVAATDVVAGLLLVAVPRFVFPPCGWAGGHGGTLCTRTAWAELALGAALVAAGGLAAAARGPRRLLAATGASCALALAAAAAPAVSGVCASSKMACHYGMAPSVRLVAGIAAAVLLGAALRLARGSRRAEEPA